MRFIRCDHCKAEAPNPRDSYLGPGSDWITVEACEDDDHGQFCSWACLAAWSTNKAMDAEMSR